MGSAVGLAYIVRKRENLFVITVIVLNGNFKKSVFTLTVLKIDGRREKHFFALVDIFDKVYYSAFIAESIASLPPLSLVGER